MSLNILLNKHLKKKTAVTLLQALLLFLIQKLTIYFSSHVHACVCLEYFRCEEVKKIHF